ncbi:MAG: TonB-dependent receptor [Steroidobacteraceae bacterium]
MAPDRLITDEATAPASGRRGGVCPRAVNRLSCLAALVAALLAAAPPAALAAGSLDAPRRLELARPTLDAALRSLARQADLQILFDPALVGGRAAPPIRATLSARAALQRLLAGTGLEAHEQAPGVVVIRAAADAVVPGTARTAPLAAATGRPIPAEEPAVLEEVIVTAQRRTERLQDVPISVTVHSAAAIDAQGARSMDDVSRLTPGVSFVRGANNNNAESSDIAIRGIASNAGAATTGIYIDDTPIHGRHLSFPSYNTYPALFDLERIEVLRGPQGTLFGAGSEGGTLRFILPEPDLQRATLRARVETALTARGDPLYEAGAAGGAPLADGRLAWRASASLRREGGYIDRVDWHAHRTLAADANAATTATARLALKAAIGEHLTITPALLYQRRRVADTAAAWAPRPGEPDPTQGQFAAPLRSGNAVASPSRDAFLLASLKLQWQLQDVTLVSSTSYFRRDQSALTDYSQYDRAIFLGDPYPAAGEHGTGHWGDAQRNWTQELRAESTAPDARVAWTAGLFYQQARETTRHRVEDADLLARLGQAPDAGGGYIYIEDPRIGIDRQIAVYGQADARLGPRLTLTLGLRYASAQFRGSARYPGTLVVGAPVQSSGRQGEAPLTPRFGLGYRLDGDRLLYATIAKGFRIGGTNPKVGQFCYGGPGSALGQIGLEDVPPTYDADSVWSYELGTKNLFGDSRLLLNASAFLVKWSDIQQNVPLTACGFQFTSNLGAAESRGFDLQAAWRPNRALTLGGTLGYTDARFTRTVQLQPSVQSIVRDGDHLAVAPWMLAAYGQFDFRLRGHSAYLRADYQYAARQRAGVPEQDPANGSYALWFEGVPRQSQVALRAGLQWAGLDLSLFVQNLFDARPRLGATQDIATPQGGTPLFYVITARPRTVGLTLTCNR